MRAAAVLAAAGLVMAANVGLIVSAARNRSGAAGGTLELTERELGLPPALGESTALFLELRWDVASSDPEDHRSPSWLTREKLIELGFDLGKPVTSPDAEGHYAATPPRPAYVVLELEGGAWRSAPNDSGRTTRLLAVDAGRDADALGARYPDRARHAIVHAVVRLDLKTHAPHGGPPLPEPRLRGWIAQIAPGEIFVPPRYSPQLLPLRRPEEEAERMPGGEPRFAARVSWGRSHEPWIEEVTLLPPQSSAPPPTPPSAPASDR